MRRRITKTETEIRITRAQAEAIREYIASLEALRDATFGVIPYRAENGQPMEGASKKVAYTCGYHAELLADFSDSAKRALERVKGIVG